MVWHKGKACTNSLPSQYPDHSPPPRFLSGYLSDTCPAAAAQFLAKSPDLEEVRRMRPRAQRPFGPSLVDLLTEHATADSLGKEGEPRHVQAYHILRDATVLSL